jgi:hypothetical protein
MGRKAIASSLDALIETATHDTEKLKLRQRRRQEQSRKSRRRTTFVFRTLADVRT